MNEPHVFVSMKKHYFLPQASLRKPPKPSHPSPPSKPEKPHRLKFALQPVSWFKQQA